MSRPLVAFALVAAAALGACAPRTPPRATSEDAIRMRVDLAQLERGRTLLVARCGSCHTVPAPSAHTPAEWPARLDEMAARSALAPAEQQAIEQYLVAVLTRTARR